MPGKKCGSSITKLRRFTNLYGRNAMQNLDENTITDEAIRRMANSRDPRFKEILTSLTDRKSVV